MADVASLGIQVRTDGTERATSELNKLSGAAARAEASTEGLTGANRGATGAASSAAQAYAREGAAAASASKQIEMMNRAANQNYRRGNVANIAAQFQDVAVSAQMGMGALQIGLQQGTQLAAVIASMENPVRGLGEALLSVVSPASLLTIGLVSLVAAGIQMVDWPKLAAAALRGLADILDEIAPYAVAAAAALALLYAPAIIGGVVQMIALLGHLATQALILAGAFAAANPATAFVLGITAAVAAAIIFRDELAQIFGRDIVADAKNGVNAVIGAFVGGYEGIRAVWSRLPAALGDIVMSTANAVIAGVESMINNVTSAINGYIQNINSMMKSLPFGMGEGVNIGTIGLVSLGRIENPYAGAANEAQSAIGSAMSSAMSTDYIGAFGSAISRGASAASAKLKELAKDLVDVDEKSKKGRGGKSETEKYSDIVDGANRRIASLQAERDAVGLTEQAALKLRYEQDLLNQAQQRGITLTAAQRLELSDLAGKMAGVETETRRAKDALEDAKDATKGFISDLRQGLMNGEGFWRSFGNAGLNVLNKIIDKVETELVDALFSLSSPGMGSSGGGFLGAIFGGIGRLFGFANGTDHARGGLAWVGERGPEIVNLPRGSQVVPTHRIKSVGAANNNQPEPVNINVNVSGARGNREIQDMVAAGVQEGLGQYDKGFAARVNDVMERH